MVWRHRVLQGLHKFALLVRIGLQRRGNAVGHQGLEAAIILPCLEACWVLQDLEQKLLMIAFKEDRFMAEAAFDQEVDGLLRCGAAINVVAEEDMKGACGPRTR